MDTFYKKLKKHNNVISSVDDFIIGLNLEELDYFTNLILKMENKMSRRDRGGSNKDKPKRYLSVAAVKENEHGTFISVNNNDYKKKNGDVYEAPGRLLFEDFETGKIYELNTISIFDAHEKAPQEILNNLSINTENEKQCEDVTKDFE